MQLFVRSLSGHHAAAAEGKTLCLITSRQQGGVKALSHLILDAVDLHAEIRGRLRFRRLSCGRGLSCLRRRCFPGFSADGDMGAAGVSHRRDLSVPVVQLRGRDLDICLPALQRTEPESVVPFLRVRGQLSGDPERTRAALRHVSADEFQSGRIIFQHDVCCSQRFPAGGFHVHGDRQFFSYFRGRVRESDPGSHGQSRECGQHAYRRSSRQYLRGADHFIHILDSP